MNIYMLIDRSGSMASKWDEAIGSVNGYIEELAKKKGTKKSKATVAVFDSQGPFDVIRKVQPVKEWNPISNEDAQPRGMTPLHDAIGKLATLVNEDKPKAATVVIVTDGLENASREVSRADAKAFLDKFRKKKFDVVFLGADFDAFAQGASLGNATGQTLNVKTGNYGATMRSLAGRTQLYASTGDVVDFTDEDRAEASGR